MSGALAISTIKKVGNRMFAKPSDGQRISVFCMFHTFQKRACLQLFRVYTWEQTYWVNLDSFLFLFLFFSLIMALASGYAVVEKLFLKMKITMATGASEIAEGEDCLQRNV